MITQPQSTERAADPTPAEVEERHESERACDAHKPAEALGDAA